MSVADCPSIVDDDVTIVTGGTKITRKRSHDNGIFSLRLIMY